MKSSIILFASALLSLGTVAAPHGYEYESSVAAVPTTSECESATWTPYDYDSESTPYVAPTEPVYPGPSSEAESTPAYYVPSSEPVATTVSTGYGSGSVPYYPDEEPTTTVTSTIESTITIELSVTTYGPTPSNGGGYWNTVVTTSCPSPSVDGGYTPYTPTLTPIPYEYSTPASFYTPEEEPTPVEYTPSSVYYYPPTNETAPTEAAPSNSTSYYTPPPYVPPYAGSATSSVRNGGIISMIAGLIGMVAVMGIL
ncbi:hypothetical protein TWF694_005515 [Orbilia ellipsospora]|uniref:Uncharacterized protein n=1 Tax=Orbilia ellipsospora TaxID=2528407 RepID=A0AAV9WUJ9_9PEZI